MIFFYKVIAVESVDNFSSLCFQLCSSLYSRSPEQSLSGIENQGSFRKKKKKRKEKNGNCTKSTCITVGRYSLLFIRVALKFRWRFTGILYWQACYQPLVKYSCNVSGEYPSSNLYGNPGDSRIYRRGFVARISARHHSENMLRVPYRFPCTVYEGL